MPKTATPSSPFPANSLTAPMPRPSSFQAIDPATGQTLPLSANEWAEGDRPVLVPMFSTHHPDAKASVIIFPGGGYGHLALHEGEGLAQFFNLLGLHAFVLFYRLGTKGHRHPAPLEDALHAISLLRAHAGEWGLDSQRIAVTGASAGGHLAATLLTLTSARRLPPELVSFSSADACPNLGILSYPVVRMETYGHRGSRQNLLGESPSAEDLTLLSANRQVTAQTPPCFVWHTVEDASVPVEDSLALATALRTESVPFELHLYEHGMHGIGIRDFTHPLLNDLRNWLDRRGWLP